MPQVKQAKSPVIPAFDKLWDYSNPSQTEKTFREFLHKFENSDLESTEIESLRLQLITQIGRTLGLQLKFDEAHGVLDEVESILKSKEEFYIARIRYLLERGRTYNSSGQKDKAIELFLNAYELGVEQKEDFYAVDAAHMLGIAESPDDGLKWNEKAMELAEKSSDERTHKWLGALYNNSGWTYHDLKEYGKALVLFEKNVEWHTERKNLRELIIARWSVARVFRSLDRIDKALEIHKNLLREIDEKGLEQDGYIYEELAECYFVKEDRENSKKYFRLAHDLLSKDIWLSEYEKDRLERLKELGS